MYSQKLLFSTNSTPAWAEPASGPLQNTINVKKLQCHISTRLNIFSEIRNIFQELNRDQEGETGEHLCKLRLPCLRM